MGKSKKISLQVEPEMYAFISQKAADTSIRELRAYSMSAQIRSIIAEAMKEENKEKKQ